MTMWTNHSLEPTPIVISVPHLRLTDLAARLSFCLGSNYSTHPLFITLI